MLRLVRRGDNKIVFGLEAGNCDAGDIPLIPGTIPEYVE